MNTVEFCRLVNKTVPDEEFITLREDRCDGCGNCANVCPSLLWAVKDGKARLAPNYKKLCLECAACMQACRSDAIGFDFPKGGTGIVVKFG